MNQRMLVFLVVAAFVSGMLVAPLRIGAATPGIISYQGRVSVGATAFTGTGQFRFALVNATGTTTFWSNDGTSTAGSQPTAAVTLAVNNGLYAVLLGDTNIGMTPIPASAFDNSDVRLRVWFNDGTNGSQLMTPDQRIASVGYAQVAKGVDDLSITTAKIADGAVTPLKTGGFVKGRVNNSNQQIVAASNFIMVSFDNEEADAFGIHNNTNQSRLTVPVSGTYLVNSQINWAGISSGYVSTQIVINGAITAALDRRTLGNGTGLGSFSLSTIVQLAAGDYVELWATNNEGSTPQFVNPGSVLSIQQLP